MCSRFPDHRAHATVMLPLPQSTSTLYVCALAYSINEHAVRLRYRVLNKRARGTRALPFARQTNEHAAFAFCNKYACRRSLPFTRQTSSRYSCHRGSSCILSGDVGGRELRMCSLIEDAGSAHLALAHFNGERVRERPRSACSFIGQNGSARTPCARLSGKRE